MCDYRWLLADWKVCFAPADAEAELDDRFAKACHHLEYVEYLLDLLLQGTEVERKQLVEEWTKDNRTKKLQQRLVANNYHFTISQRARDNISSAVKEANNIIDFLTSEGYVEFIPEGETSTKDLYDAYCSWCDDNAEIHLSAKSFANFMAQYAGNYGLTGSNNIYIGKGKRCRGYKGIQTADPDNPFL